MSALTLPAKTNGPHHAFAAPSPPPTPHLRIDMEAPSQPMAS